MQEGTNQSSENASQDGKQGEEKVVKVVFCEGGGGEGSNANNNIDINKVLDRKEITIRDALRMLFYVMDKFVLSVSSSDFDEFEEKLECEDELTEGELRDFLKLAEMIFSDEDEINNVIEEIKTALKNK